MMTATEVVLVEEGVKVALDPGDLGVPGGPAGDGEALVTDRPHIISSTSLVIHWPQ